jgi:hypothetical protein
MYWRKLAWVAALFFVAGIVAPVASADPECDEPPPLTSSEVKCGKFMTKMARKYREKHLKLVGKCTDKMDASDEPGSETCDDGYDPTLYLTDPNKRDFAIDTFYNKFLLKMQKKCITKLGLGPNSIKCYGCGRAVTMASAVWPPFGGMQTELPCRRPMTPVFARFQ